MSSRKDTSLLAGAGFTLAGIIGIILFILNSNPEILTIFQIFSKKITLEFLQWMSVLALIIGIALLVDGAKAPS